MERVMEYIFAIAKFKSVSKAAENLFISQPALSAIVKKEEKRLGVELFDRQYKPLQLTNAGTIYVNAAKKIKDIEEKMLYDLNCKEQNGVRKITIASYAFLFTHFLANFVEKFKSQLSRDIEIELIEKRTEEALPGIQKGIYDFAITTHQRRVKGCSSVPLLKEKVIIAVPKSYAINSYIKKYALSYQDVVAGAANSDKYSSVSISYFADYPFILHVKTKEMYRRARRIFRNSGINPKVVSYMEDFLLMYFVANSGQGIIFMREAMIQYMEPSDKLVFYKINDPATVYNVNVYYRKESENKKEIRAFIDSCNSYWNANYSEESLT